MIDLFAPHITIGDYKTEYWIDGLESDEYSFKFWGWAIINDIPSWKLDLKIDFKGTKYSFSYKPININRNDVTMINGKGIVNYDASGFFIEVFRQHIGQDSYNIELSFREKKSNEKILAFPFLCLKVE